MRTIIVLLLITCSAFGTDYVLYHKTSSPVTNQVVMHRPNYAPAIPNANYGLLSYSRKPLGSNWNGVLPSLASNSATIHWTKVSNNLVVNMTATESNSIITAQANANAVASSNALVQAQIESKNTATNYFDTLDESTKRVMRALAEVTRQAVNTNRIADGFPAITVLQWRTRVMEEINAQPNTQ